MKIFISWSQFRSMKVAEGLAALISAVIEGTEPWVSVHIGSGEKFVQSLHLHLNETDFAIICLTEDTRESRWISYELGALMSRGVKVCPYLIDQEMPRDLPLPLPPDIQSCRATEDGTRELLQDIKKQMQGVELLSESDRNELKGRFDQHWPGFDKILKKGQLRSVKSALEFCQGRVNDVIDLSNELDRYFEHLKLAMWNVIPDAVALYDSRRAEIKVLDESDPVFAEVIGQIKQRAWIAINHVRKKLDKPHRVVGNVEQFLTANYEEKDLEKFLITVAKTLDDDSVGALREERLRKEIELEINRVFLKFLQEAAKLLLTSFKL